MRPAPVIIPAPALRNLYLFSVLFALLIVLAALSALPVAGQSVTNGQRIKTSRARQTYSYLIEQDGALAWFKNKFPRLTPRILQAQTAFDSTFGKARLGVNTYLTEQMGQSEFNAYTQTLASQIQKLLDQKAVTEPVATDFIAQVESRARGTINTPVLETLLSFQFAGKPEDEFLLGFTTVFKTRGHAKAQNTDWQVSVPKSFLAQQATTAQVIQRFTSDYGVGNQAITLMVNNIPSAKHNKLTGQEIEDFLTEKTLRELVSTEGELISFTKLTLDHKPAAMVETEIRFENQGKPTRIRAIQFILVQGDKIYILLTTVLSDQPKADMNLEVKKYLPLFQLIAQSLVINE